MKNFIIALLLISVVVLVGCTAQKDTTINLIKDKYGQIQDYTCDGYTACVEGNPGCVDGWAPTLWKVKEPDKILIEYKLPERDVGVVARIANGNKESEVTRSFVGEKTYFTAFVKNFPTNDAERLVSTEGIINMVSYIFDNPDLYPKLSIRKGEFTYPVFINKQQAITAVLIENSDSNDFPIVLEGETFLPVRTPYMIFRDCKVNTGLTSSDFDVTNDFDVKNVKVVATYDYTKTCVTNQDCDDGSPTTRGECKEAGWYQNYCSYYPQ